MVTFPIGWNLMCNCAAVTGVLGTSMHAYSKFHGNNFYKVGGGGNEGVERKTLHEYVELPNAFNIFDSSLKYD